MCCMRTSKAFRQQQLGSCGSMMVRGRFQFFPRPCWSSSSDPLPDQPLFVALCAPTVDRVPSCDSHLCQSFGSLHGPDMTFVQLSDRCVIRQIPSNYRTPFTNCLLTPCFFLSGFCTSWVTRQKKWQAGRGTVSSTLKIFPPVPSHTEDYVRLKAQHRHFFPCWRKLKKSRLVKHFLMLLPFTSQCRQMKNSGWRWC